MNINIDNELITLLRHIRIGLLTSEVDCALSSLELTVMISEYVKQIENNYKLDAINQIENIKSSRIAYKRLGNDPSRYRPSAESLYRRIVKGYGLYEINNVVDILNFISLQSGISIGGYDCDKINGEINLGVGRKGEPYQGIGRGVLNISFLPVLRDLLGAFGTPTSDSERTKITKKTKHIAFVLFDFGYDPQLEMVMKNCLLLLEKYCSAKEMDYQIVISAKHK
jgi:DNA/RNA-binding domain of Phe-tRNA-synthetase-like protein